MARRAGLVLLTSLALAILPNAFPSSASTGEPLSLRARIDSLFFVSRFDSALVLIYPEIERARSQGDSITAGRLHTEAGRAEMMLGRAADATDSFDAV